MTTIETARDITGEVVPGVVVPAHRPGWHGLLRSRKLVAGATIVGFFGLVAVVGPLLVGDPHRVSDDQLLAPSTAHLLGTTTTGQDVFRQLVVATRGSMIVGLVVGLLATAVSVLVGVVGGYAGGHADEGLSLVSNVFLVLPGLPLVVLITDYVQTRGALAIALIVSITSWAGSARVLRAQTLSLRSRDYVDAARVSGEPGWRIVAVEILPNLLPLIAAQFVFAVIGGILTEAALAFIGLGGSGSWGTMLYYAQNSQALSQGAWWWFLPPGLCIALVGAGLALINFSLDELINPRLRATRRRRSTAAGPAR